MVPFKPIFLLALAFVVFSVEASPRREVRDPQPDPEPEVTKSQLKEALVRLGGELARYEANTNANIKQIKADVQLLKDAIQSVANAIKDVSAKQEENPEAQATDADADALTDADRDGDFEDEGAKRRRKRRHAQMM